MPAFAVDLGTTNSAIATWDAGTQQPLILELPEVCRAPAGEDPLEAPRVVPSATEVVADAGWRGRLGRWPPVQRRWFVGQLAHIGRPALERNQGLSRPAFVPSFKPYLGQAPLRTLARLGQRPYSAREIAFRFVRELLAQAAAVTGARPRELVFTAPVEAYESYRAELKDIGQRLGVRQLRFVDEPVAAALGYGVGGGRERLVLVLDFGGGTLDLALARVGGRSALQGRCDVIAKEGRAVGGNAVDGWLLQHVCDQLAIPVDERRDDATWLGWLNLMREEACRVKEALFLRPQEAFRLIPPEELRRFQARLAGTAEAVEVRREDLVALLEARGLYRDLDACLDAVATQARAAEVELDAIDEVLMVGGSTLLPGVFPRLHARFGRDRVRGWQPFEAVAFGAAAVAAGQQVQSDFIVHDYAFVVHDPVTNAPQHTLLIPRGTRFPTAPSFWKRQLVPTCPLGEPELVFKLVVCEVGRSHGDERRFGWDSGGDLHKLGGRAGSEPLVVPLNEANPTLGRLRPPHPPGDRRPRLEISFGVNADRWLVATVVDLWSHRTLMQAEPVVRLL